MTAAAAQFEIQEAPAAVRALTRSLVWCVGTGTAAGAAVLLALVGALLGAVLAFFPALPACLALAAAARWSRTARAYRRWVVVVIAGLAALIPLVGLWLYRSFSSDLEDDQQALAVAVGASFVVAEGMLVPMWRSLRSVRDEPED